MNIQVFIVKPVQTGVIFLPQLLYMKTGKNSKYPHVIFHIFQFRYTKGKVKGQRE